MLVDSGEIRITRDNCIIFFSKLPNVLLITKYLRTNTVSCNPFGREEIRHKRRMISKGLIAHFNENCASVFLQTHCRYLTSYHIPIIKVKP